MCHISNINIFKSVQRWSSPHYLNHYQNSLKCKYYADFVEVTKCIRIIKGERLNVSFSYAECTNNSMPKLFPIETFEICNTENISFISPCQLSSWHRYCINVLYSILVGCGRMEEKM